MGRIKVYKINLLIFFLLFFLNFSTLLTLINLSSVPNTYIWYYNMLAKAFSLPGNINQNNSLCHTFDDTNI